MRHGRLIHGGFEASNGQRALRRNVKAKTLVLFSNDNSLEEHTSAGRRGLIKRQARLTSIFCSQFCQLAWRQPWNTTVVQQPQLSSACMIRREATAVSHCISNALAGVVSLLSGDGERPSSHVSLSAQATTTRARLGTVKSSPLSTSGLPKEAGRRQGLDGFVKCRWRLCHALLGAEYGGLHVLLASWHVQKTGLSRNLA